MKCMGSIHGMHGSYACDVWVLRMGCMGSMDAMYGFYAWDVWVLYAWDAWVRCMGCMHGKGGGWMIFSFFDCCPFYFLLIEFHGSFFKSHKII